mmetsp:Transcript_38064/g.79139  ORF Transcript_38064/g.79139 Transcript_38064/m.79139 type:complete len:253 (+) Transcript_38064:898-1656(+)
MSRGLPRPLVMAPMQAWGCALRISFNMEMTSSNKYRSAAAWRSVSQTWKQSSTHSGGMVTPASACAAAIRFISWAMASFRKSEYVMGAVRVWRTRRVVAKKSVTVVAKPYSCILRIMRSLASLTTSLVGKSVSSRSNDKNPNFGVWEGVTAFNASTGELQKAIIMVVMTITHLARDAHDLPKPSTAHFGSVFPLLSILFGATGLVNVKKWLTNGFVIIIFQNTIQAFFRFLRTRFRHHSVVAITSGRYCRTT